MNFRLSLRQLFLSLAVLVMLSGCVSDHAERVYLNLTPSATKPDLLYQIPTRPFDVVADIQWMGHMTSKMVARAQALGGDAVIVQYLGGLVPFASLTAEEANVRSKTFTRLSGTVIKYKK